jgi:PAS domain S-box-containing protein
MNPFGFSENGTVQLERQPEILEPNTPMAQVKHSSNLTLLPPLSSQTQLPLDPAISLTLNTIVDAVVVADAKGTILCFNKAASLMFGWTHSEIVGKMNVSALMPGYYSKEHDRIMSDYAEGTRPPRLLGVTRTLKGRKKDGQNFAIDISLGEFPKEWIKDQQSLQNSVYDLKAVYVATIRDAGKGTVEQPGPRFGQSRYQKEFEQMEFLGKGGFGAVYRVRNLLDGQDYAVKKLRLSCRPEDYIAAIKASPEELEAAAEEVEPRGSGTTSPSNSMSHASADGKKLLGLSKDDIRIIREVQTFAKISNHPNIVRYFNSWVEATVDDLPESPTKPKAPPAPNNSLQTVPATKSISAEELRKKREAMAQRFGMKIATPNGAVFESKSRASSHACDDSYCTTCDGSSVESFADSNSSCHDPDCSCQSNEQIQPIATQTIKRDVPNLRSILKRGDLTESTVPEKRRVCMNPEVEVSVIHAPSAETSDDSRVESQPSSLPRMRPTMPSRPSLSTVVQLHVPAIQRSLSDQADEDDDSSDVSEVQILPPNHPPVPAGGVCPMQKDGGAGLRNLVAQANSMDPILDNGQKRATILFIIMQLCSGTSLHTFLQERNAEPNPVIDRVRNIQIFEQIVRGLMHVHASGFVHRDIKPGNVFLEGTHVFVGDFGLAKDMSKSKGEAVELDSNAIETDKQLVHVNLSNQSMPLTIGVGTLLYASPEQLNSRKYDSKTDIYSLGVLFFELFHPLSTPMERVNTLLELRKGNVPTSFQKRWPKEHQLLLKMISPDPLERPTAIQILASNVIKGSAPLTSSDLSSMVSRHGNKTQVQLEQLAGKLTKLAMSDSDGENTDSDGEVCLACSDKDDLIKALKRYTRKMERRIEELEHELEKRMKI